MRKRSTAYVIHEGAPGLSHERRLDRLAAIAVQVGLRPAPGQELVMSAPIEALPLARRITEHAYKAGASLVTPLFSDDASTLLRSSTPQTKASTRRPCGCTRAWRRHSATVPRGL
jgi:leucyl aminopeptidase (aminopeptidase T)